MISNYLKALIDSNNRIIVPDFGAFMIQDSPTGKQISFNDFLKFNDGLLVNQIIKTDKISKNQATEQIKEFITEVEKTFSQNKPYEVLGLGFLSKDSHGNIKFETKIELAKEDKKTPTDVKPTMVLDEEPEKPKEIKKEEKKFVAPPIEEKKIEVPIVAIPKVEEKKPQVTATAIPKTEEKKTEPIVKPASALIPEAKPFVKMTDKKPVAKITQKKSSASKIVIIFIALAIIIGGGTYAYLQYSMFKKVLPVVEVAPIAVPEPVIDTLPAADTIMAEPTVIEEGSVDANIKKFYLVAGSFKVPSNADRFNKKLIAEGFESEVIVRNNGFHCVTLNSFSTRNEVVAEWRKMKDEKPEIWILIQ